MAVIRPVILARVPPAPKHEGTAARTMELGRAWATPRRPLTRGGGTEAEGGASPEHLGGARREPSGDSQASLPAIGFLMTAAGSAATNQVTEKGHSSGTSCGEAPARLTRDR